MSAIHAFFPLTLAAATTAPASQPAEAEVLTVVAGIAGALIAIATAWAIRVHRGRNVIGPTRLASGRAIFPLVVVAAGAMLLWQGIVPGLYIGMKQAELAGSGGSDGRITLQAFRPIDFAWLATVPCGVGFLALWVGDLLTDVLGGRRILSAVGDLGLRLNNVAAGVGKGVIGSVIAMPLMFWFLVALEVLYRQVGFQHPNEHDLLRVMTEAGSPAVRWALIGGATVAAPLFEEYVFRGHLQTAMREGLARIGPNRATGVASASLGPAPVLSYETSTIDAPASAGPRPTAFQAWQAILLTSVLFTAVHGQLWMFPPIFLLSLALGYAYERTGNLWTCITIHAIFNAGSTAIYLSQGGAG